MKITVNKDVLNVEEGMMLHDLTKQLGMAINTVAIWINGKHLMFEDYKKTELHDGDNIQILYMCIGG